MVDFARRSVERKVGDTLNIMHCGVCYKSEVIYVGKDLYGGYFWLKFTDARGIDMFRQVVM